MSDYLLLIPIFAFFDRWCGGGAGWRSTFRGRPIYYVALLILPLIYFKEYLLAEILGCWCLWRWPAWKLFGGSIVPVTGREILGTAARHSLIAGVLVICLGAPPIAWIISAAILALWVWLATSLARFNARNAAEGVDVNGFVEITRGWLFGLAAFIIIMALEVLK